MTPQPAEATLSGALDLVGLEPIERIKRRWPTILGSALTLLMIVALVRELSNSGLAGLDRAIPDSPFFYAAFAIFYLAPPTFDYLIFRRLWGIPLDGMAAVHKKRIANEVLIGYSGEAYFYAWARQRLQMIAAPFGAVKDVTIQSAIAGNTFTLALILLVAPFAPNLKEWAVNPTTILISALVMILNTLPFFIFSRRVFSLPTPTLWWVYGMHIARLLIVTLSAAFAWHFAMPQVAMGTWILMAAVRMLVTRLPFVPNKELLMLPFVIMLFGSGTAVTELFAFVAALCLLLHVTLILGFSVESLIKRFR